MSVWRVSTPRLWPGKFDGLTLDDAVRKLHWPAGTVRSRLARARDKLRRELTRRGIVLPAAAMAAALTPKSASASVSSSLCDATTNEHGAGSPWKLARTASRRKSKTEQLCWVQVATMVQIRSSQRWRASLRDPWVMCRSMTTKRMACSAKLLVGSMPGVVISLM